MSATASTQDHSTELAPYTATEVKVEFVAHDKLDPKQLMAARKEAGQLYEQLITNPAVFGRYGEKAVEPLNQLADQIVRGINPSDIPEVEKILREAQDEFHRLHSKYGQHRDRSNSRLKHWADKLKDIFGNAADFIDMLRTDSLEVLQLLDKLVAQIESDRKELVRNQTTQRVVIDRNKQAGKDLLVVIAVMELTLERAQTELSEVNGKLSSADPATEQDLRDRRDDLTSFVMKMEMKIIDYKNRFLLSLANGVQTRRQMEMDQTLDAKVYSVEINVVPKMKSTIAAWAQLQQSLRTAESIQALDRAANEVEVGFADALRQTSATVNEVTGTPSIKPETVSYVAEQFAAMIDDTIQALADRRTRIAESNQAIVESGRRMAEASSRLAEAAADHAMRDSVVADVDHQVTQLLEAAQAPLPTSITRIPSSDDVDKVLVGAGSHS